MRRVLMSLLIIVLFLGASAPATAQDEDAVAEAAYQAQEQVISEMLSELFGQVQRLSSEWTPGNSIVAGELAGTFSLFLAVHRITEELDPPEAMEPQYTTLLEATQIMAKAVPDCRNAILLVDDAALDRCVEATGRSGELLQT